MVSGIIFFTLFNRPVEKVEDIRQDLSIIKKLILVLIIIIFVGGVYVGFQ